MRGIVYVFLLFFISVRHAFAETDPDPTITYWAHIVVTLFGLALAMRLAAAAFARPPLKLVDVPTDPRYLTSRQYYWFGLIIFTIIASFLFLILIYLHKEVLKVAAITNIPFLPESTSKAILDAVSNDSAPYLLIVICMGAIFLFFLKKEAEWNVLLMMRDVIHIWVYIPRRAKEIVDEIKYSLSVPPPSAATVSSLELGVNIDDFEKGRETLVRLWAELSYIRWWVENQRSSGPHITFFDKEEFDLDQLLMKYEGKIPSVTPLVAKLRFGSDPDGHALADALKPDLTELRDKFARVAACFLVHKYGLGEGLDIKAKDFGIPTDIPTEQNPLKYIAIYLITIATAVYVGVYVSAMVFDWYSGEKLFNFIHQDLELVQRWVTLSAANYGLAIAFVLLIRFIEWFFFERTKKLSRLPLLTYCWTFMIAFFVGPLGLALAVKYYFKVQQYLDMSLFDTFTLMLKWGTGPAVIAVFISYYMDRQTSSGLPDIEQSRGSILWRIVVSLGVSLITMCFLFLPLVSIQAADGAHWNTEKLQAVATGTTFLLLFSLALVAQFALRKSRGTESTRESN